MKISELKFTINGQNVKLKHKKSDTCAKVKLAENVDIPPKSETVFKGQVQGDCLARHSLIESDFKIKHKELLLARSLNSTICGKQIPMIILNLTDKSINTVRQERRRCFART